MGPRTQLRSSTSGKAKGTCVEQWSRTRQNPRAFHAASPQTEGTAGDTAPRRGSQILPGGATRQTLREAIGSQVQPPRREAWWAVSSGREAGLGVPATFQFHSGDAHSSARAHGLRGADPVPSSGWEGWGPSSGCRQSKPQYVKRGPPAQQR